MFVTLLGLRKFFFFFFLFLRAFSVMCFLSEELNYAYKIFKLRWLSSYCLLMSEREF
jgi:hypothetical protein